MDYRIEVYDTAGCRVATYEESPLLEVSRRGPDEADVIRGILPGPVTRLSHGFVVKVFVDGRLFCSAKVTRVLPQWSDSRKLILDRYVTFHEVVAFEAEGGMAAGNVAVTQVYAGCSISTIVKHLINSAPGPIHYGVAHTGYPDGARREYTKFLARKSAANILATGRVDQGQWVDAARIDRSHAVAKDGNTISGLVVDGVAWPDVRLMMVGAEELMGNARAWARHPEVAAWSSEQYAASGYCLRGGEAKAALQNLLGTKGIDFLELNSHRGGDGHFDGRVDAYGRYVALVYGGGECLNAAMIEQGHADVELYGGGSGLVPEMELKDFLSYAGPSTDTVEDCATLLAAFSVEGGVYEAVTALAYAGEGYVWSVDPGMALRFYQATAPERVYQYDPVSMRVALGSDSGELINALYVSGNPVTGSVSKAYRRGDSAEEYGTRPGQLEYFPLTVEADADKLAGGLLQDLAYPSPCGAIEVYRGDAEVRVGDLVEVRNAPLRRLEKELGEEWGGGFAAKLVGRARRVTHRFSGRQVSTTVALSSPLRSIQNPLEFMVRGQRAASTLFEFRLDVPAVGLGADYHLD